MRSLVVVAGAMVCASCADLPLASTEQGITVSPGAWDFGSATVGTEIGPRAITVSYGTGFGTDQVVAITGCPDFRVDLRGQSLPYEINRSCDTGQAVCQTVDSQTLVLDVYFRPSVANVESCTVVVELTDSPAQIAPLTGMGTAAAIDVGLAQPTGGSIDFGDVITGAASTPRVITVRSDGGSVLDITAVTPSGTGFAVAGTVPITLPPGLTASYPVRCTAAGPGVLTGSVDIASTDPDENPVSIGLRCNGIQSPLGVDPSPASLPETRVGNSSELAIQLDNSGLMPLVIDNVAVTGEGLSITSLPASSTLAPGAVTTMTVGFSPIADGDVTGVLTLLYDGGQVRTTAIDAPGRLATLSVTPSGRVDFGPICVGQTATRPFVALDTGTSAFVVQDVAVTGVGFTLTPLVPATFPAVLDALGAGTVTFDVGVAPIAAGELAGAVTITTDIPNRPTEAIDLRATALAGGTTTTPAELDTGAAVIGSGAGARPIALSNCEADDLSITSVAIEGDAEAEFAIVTAPATMAVPAGTTTTWLVELRPTSPGVKTATFHIVHGRGTADVTLVGDGLDATGHTDADGRGSYYACSTTGGPGGLVVIALALGLGLGGRGRRRWVR